jgi:FKBP-type peptidyl-prolyl cis-trans isomerase 2
MKKTVMGDNVIIEYEGMLQDGEIIESSSDSGPFEYKVGSGLMPPGFENALLGMKEGDEKAVTLQPDEAFGLWDDKLLHTMKKKAFGEAIQPKPGMVLGMTVSKEGQQQQIPALVTAVKNDDVTIDFNHPLAGKTIIYKLTLKKIR